MSQKKAAGPTLTVVENKPLLHLGTEVKVHFGIAEGDDVHALPPLVLNVSRLCAEAFTELQEQIALQRQAKFNELNGIGSDEA